jgi:hypothetical protein
MPNHAYYKFTPFPAELAVAKIWLLGKVPPMKEIVVDPEVLGGIPVFAGTRVPVRNLFDYLEAGDSLADFLKAFPDVEREQVIAVLKAAKATLLEPQPVVDLRARGIDASQASDLRARLDTFAEDWNRPEAAVYDEAPPR